MNAKLSNSKRKSLRSCWEDCGGEWDEVWCVGIVWRRGRKVFIVEKISRFCCFWEMILKVRVLCMKKLKNKT